MKPLVTPTVNMNGNDGMQLVGMALDIKHAIENALDVMTKGLDLTHGRNFFGKHTNVSALEGSLKVASEARAAFNQRAFALNDMANDFEALALALHKQVNPDKVVSKPHGKDKHK